MGDGMMTTLQAMQILKLHNKWRRDRSEKNLYPMQDPIKIGEAIDVAVRILAEIANKD
jgi:hypothetical protein